MGFFVKAEDLRKALRDIESAEKNGFMFCNAIFEARGVDGVFIKLEYSDMWEKAHPTDGSLDWGRFQGVSQRNKFKNGKLIPVKKGRAD